MRAQPFAIRREPQGYRLELPGREPETYRRRRDALSHALEATRSTRQLIR